MKKREELKPFDCPFCGTKPIMHYDTLDHHFCIACPNCNARIHLGFSKKEEAIQAWNTRAEQKPDLDEEKIIGFLKYELEKSVGNFCCNGSSDEECSMQDHHKAYFWDSIAKELAKSIHAKFEQPRELFVDYDRLTHLINLFVKKISMQAGIFDLNRQSELAEYLKEHESTWVRPAKG